MIFRWKAVVDSVQFRVILNITTKRFDVASWHAEMLRFGRRPTAADAASRNDPSREKQLWKIRRFSRVANLKILFPLRLPEQSGGNFKSFTPPTKGA